jgi:hypothetical protein
VRTRLWWRSGRSAQRLVSVSASEIAGPFRSDRLDQRLRAEHGDHPFQIVGQNVEVHLCSDLVEGPGKVWRTQ